MKTQTINSKLNTSKNVISEEWLKEDEVGKKSFTGKISPKHFKNEKATA